MSDDNTPNTTVVDPSQVLAEAVEQSSDLPASPTPALNEAPEDLPPPALDVPELPMTVHGEAPSDPDALADAHNDLPPEPMTVPGEAPAGVTFPELQSSPANIDTQVNDVARYADGVVASGHGPLPLASPNGVIFYSYLSKSGQSMLNITSTNWARSVDHLLPGEPVVDAVYQPGSIGLFYSADMSEIRKLVLRADGTVASDLHALAE